MPTAILILNSVGLGGVALFLVYMFKGLRAQIAALKTLAEEQGKTLAAVRERAEEFDRLSKGYKQALTDFEEMGAKLDARRAELVKELESAVAAKDSEIAAAKKDELRQVDIDRANLAQLPTLLEKVDHLHAKLEETTRRFSRPIYFSGGSRVVGGSHFGNAFGAGSRLAQVGGGGRMWLNHIIQVEEAKRIAAAKAPSGDPTSPPKDSPPQSGAR